MGHNGWIARAARFESVQRTETSRELMDDAVALVGKWNTDIERRKGSQYGYADRARLPQFSPHIGAAILAKKPWLRLLCPACQQQGAVDLRKVVRPADYPIAGLYDALTCTFGPCRGDGPRPVMLGLFAGRADPAAKPASESVNPANSPAATRRRSTMRLAAMSAGSRRTAPFSTLGDVSGEGVDVCFKLVN